METLVFFDLETTGLIPNINANDPRNPPKIIPGDVTRNVQELFDSYVNIDNSGEINLPKIIEFSMVALPKDLFVNNITKLHEKHREHQRDFRSKISTNILTLKMNPELTNQQWAQYIRTTSKITNLQKGDLISQPIFKQQWPIIKCFLDNLPGNVTLIAHNGINFDFRIFLNELKNNNLLTDSLFTSKVKFLDSLLAFRDIEKAHHDTVNLVVENVDWKAVTEPFLKKARVEVEDDIAQESNVQMDSVQTIIINQPAPSVSPTKNMNMETLFDSSANKESNSEAEVLKRPPICNVTPTKQPPLANLRWKSAPAKVMLKRGVFGQCSEISPLRFMTNSNWSPAKIHRLKDDLFVTSTTGSWKFHRQASDDHFFARGKFKLSTIYKEIYNTTYSEHSAQEDSQALLEVCLAYGGEFISYMDKRSVHFTAFGQRND